MATRPSENELCSTFKSSKSNLQRGRGGGSSPAKDNPRNSGASKAHRCHQNDLLAQYSIALRPRRFWIIREQGSGLAALCPARGGPTEAHGGLSSMPIPQSNNTINFSARNQSGEVAGR